MNRLTLILLLAGAPAAFAQRGWISAIQRKGFHRLEDRRRSEHIQDKGRRNGRQRPSRARVLRWAGQQPRLQELRIDGGRHDAPNSNGGIYFHTEFQEKGFPKKGFEVQVNTTHRIRSRAAACIT